MPNREPEIYETLWREAHAGFAQCRLQVDANLSEREHDLRRGVTILLRPAPPVCARVKQFLDRLAVVCPDQHFYLPDELHVTVLSVISGSERWREEIRHLAKYRAIIREVLSQQRLFRLRFKGITASSSAIMIRGFQVDGGLQQIREALRTAFARCGFGHTLDRRYKISTSHLTAMRFRSPHLNWKEFIPLLEQSRELDFGETTVDTLQLIWGDWYASAGIVQPLEQYALV